MAPRIKRLIIVSVRRKPVLDRLSAYDKTTWKQKLVGVPQNGNTHILTCDQKISPSLKHKPTGDEWLEWGEFCNTENTLVSCNEGSKYHSLFDNP